MGQCFVFSLVCSSVLRPALVVNRNETKSGVYLLTYSRGIGTIVISCIVRDRDKPAVNFVFFFYLIVCGWVGVGGWVGVCVCVGVCVRERERERERGGGREFKDKLFTCHKLSCKCF